MLIKQMSLLTDHHYLLKIELLRDKIFSFESYPFNLDIIFNLDCIEFHPKVTYIVGENGSGKSTLLEAIATAWGFNPEGGTKNFNFSTRTSHSDLYKYIRLIKGFKRPRDGFFLRAESFYNVASNIDELDEGPGGPPIKNSYGGVSLHKQSHGEAFFSLMLNRFSGNGLYILDEPEAALSPTRQMAILSRMHSLVQHNAQFIIATHSPILMAYPDADILKIEKGGLIKCSYEETEHFQVTKDFLMNREKLLKILMN